MLDMLPQYWGELKKSAIGWVHPDDERFLRADPHSFNLDFPPPAFFGDVIKAKVIVLTANGGYKAEHTPVEFASEDSDQLYLSRLKEPTGANWAEVAPYYGRVNYASLLFDGLAVGVNACAYRSPKISEEFNNQKLITKLPSVAVHKKWLAEVVLPDANAGRRLIIGKRYGLWKLPSVITSSRGYIADPAPISPNISSGVFEKLRLFLKSSGGAV